MSNTQKPIEDFFKDENTPQQEIGDFFNEKEDENEEFTIPDEIVIDETEFDENELVSRIVENSCGKDDTGLPKGATTLSLERRNPDNSIYKTLCSLSSNKATLNIERKVEYVQIDMTYKSAVDSDLKLAWNTLERFGREVNQFSEEDSPTFPNLSLTVVPVCDKGKYYFICLNPVMWALTALTPGGQPNTIRILFPADQIGFFKDEELDMTEIEAEALRAVENLEQRAENLYKKEEEDKAIQDERNKQIEAMRRK